jgi:hypothetical protein
LPFGIKTAEYGTKPWQRNQAAKLEVNAMNLRTGILAGVIAILAVVAVLGWTHGRATQQGNIPVTYAQPTGYNAAPAYSPNAAPAYYPNSAPAYYPNGGPPVYSQEQPEPYVNVIHRPVVIQQEPAPAPVYSPVYGAEPRPGVARERAYRERVYVEEGARHHHHRSTKKSVAIVAGSAGAGAAIGALAGGGKGAGIGALAGGAGGFIYDRLTHNR